MSAADCLSHFCVDGVCCDGACTGSCTSCNQIATLGNCTNVPRSQTPAHGTCGLDPMASCGHDGKCDGAGSCEFWDGNTVCGMGSCSAGMMTVAPRCDGAGKCVAATPIPCDPYVCKSDGSACFTSCTPGTTAQCKSTTCDATGSCGPRGRGQACSMGSDCMSGNCVDNVCCDTPQASCNGCMICNGTTPGKCVPAAANTDPHNACTASAITAGNCIGDNCDGNGNCGGRPGACSASCSNGQITQAQCSGTSTSCPATTNVACAGFLLCADSASCKQSCGGDGDCVGGYWCNAGNCTAKGGNGAGCSGGNQCTSGNCVDSTCCSAMGCGSCYACNISGHQGGCYPVPAHQDPHHACSALSCYDGCDGNGGCFYECAGNSVCKCGGMCLCSSCSCP